MTACVHDTHGDEQETLSPITPLEQGGEMFERAKSIPLFPPGTFAPINDFHRRMSRALSEATEIWEEQDARDDGTDFDEDEAGDESEFEEDSPAYSFTDSVRTKHPS